VSQVLTFDRIERLEAEAGLDAFNGTSESVKHQLGLISARIGGTVALATTKDPSGQRNTVTALGVDQPLQRRVLSELIEFFRAAGVTRATLKIAVPALTNDADQLRRACGLALGPAAVKLLRPTDTAIDVETTLRIAEVDPGQYPDVVAFAAQTSMVAAEHAALMAGFLQRDDYHAFAAWDGAELVAISVMRFPGDYADLVGTTTLPSYRRRGAQTALTAARAALARERGVDWLLVETAVPPNSSHSNMLRYGFTEGYVRQQWIWRL
jgi:GNAT superfamily N-acetyltransferase